MPEGITPESPGSMRAYTDIGRFLAMFENGKLAFDLFTVLEDGRLDYRINVEYPGIRRAAPRPAGCLDRPPSH